MDAGPADSSEASHAMSISAKPSRTRQIDSDSTPHSGTEALMRSFGNIDVQLLSLLECPRDRSELRFDGGRLHCARGHSYPIVSGIPVFLLAEKEQTMRIA